MTAHQGPAPAEAAAVRLPRKYSPALEATLCARLANGESTAEVCADPDMPARETIRRWCRQMPDFNQRIVAARKAGGLLVRGRTRAFCPHIGRLILRRIAEGATMDEARAGVGMPALATIYKWIHEREDFARAYAQARMLQAHGKFDQVWVEARAATAGCIMVARTRIDALKWQAARLAPTRYGPKPELEAWGSRGTGEAEDEPDVIYVRRFSDNLGDGIPVYDRVVWNAHEQEPRPPWEL